MQISCCRGLLRGPVDRPDSYLLATIHFKAEPHELKAGDKLVLCFGVAVFDADRESGSRMKMFCNPGRMRNENGKYETNTGIRHCTP